MCYNGRISCDTGKTVDPDLSFCSFSISLSIDHILLSIVTFFLKGYITLEFVKFSQNVLRFWKIILKSNIIRYSVFIFCLIWTQILFHIMKFSSQATNLIFTFYNTIIIRPFKKPLLY